MNPNSNAIEVDPLLRENDILGKKDRADTGIWRVSRSYFREQIRAGEFPKPLKIGRLSFWRRSTVISAIDRLTEGAK